MAFQAAIHYADPATVSEAKLRGISNHCTKAADLDQQVAEQLVCEVAIAVHEAAWEVYAAKNQAVLDLSKAKLTLLLVGNNPGEAVAVAEQLKELAYVALQATIHFEECAKVTGGNADPAAVSEARLRGISHGGGPHQRSGAAEGCSGRRSREGTCRQALLRGPQRCDEW